MLGEETVLLKALEGKRGQPEQRPPHPATRGLSAGRRSSRTSRPSPPCPWILAQRRATRSPRSAPRRSPGTILVQVRGPQGERRRRGPDRARRSASIIDAGRRARGRAPAQGACSSAARRAASCRPTSLDTPYEFEALRAVGAHVGSGSVVAADERACVVDLARLLTRFCADEACGKTIPCRIGLRRITEIGDRIATGRPAADGRRRSSTDLAHDVVGLRAVRPRAPGDAPVRRAGCDTSGPSSTTTSSAAPARPASASPIAVAAAAATEGRPTTR